MAMTSRFKWRLPTVCILAGGPGTRLGEITRFQPKALVEVAGQPFIFHQLRFLAAARADRVVVCVGHLGEQIEERVGEERFGLTIAYSYDGPGQIGTLGAIRKAAPLLGERFIYLYGDTYLRGDFAAADRAWLKSGKPALMTVLKNAGRWGVSNADFANDLIVAYDKSNPTPSMRWIDYGLGGLTSDALALAGPEERDLAMLHSRLAKARLLFGFEVNDRFYEIGTPTALAETDRFLSSNSDIRGARVGPEGRSQTKPSREGDE
jgi:N-acetyl-alpha-D-muramate 1-phosphate uridylyltransferase